MTSFIALLAGLVIVAIVLWDAFETMILPRRVTRRFRLTRLFRVATWQPYAAFGRRVAAGAAREDLLSLYGPLSLLVLLALWATALIVGFALLHLGLGSRLHPPDAAPDLGLLVYLSGTTFFTLGFGDVTPLNPLGRALAVFEAGVGFGFLALVIGYLPVLYQAFSTREVSISLLDGRAGSPPTAGELLRRLASDRRPDALEPLLLEAERWAAQLLESHLSYPVLAYFRSQHERESWLAGLTATLDACALVLAAPGALPARQARLTFALARHAAVDLAQVFLRAPSAPARDRLPPEALARLRALLAEAGLPLVPDEPAERRLAELRALYEPHVQALSTYLLLPLPPWLPDPDARDDWQVSPDEAGRPRRSAP